MAAERRANSEGGMEVESTEGTSIGKVNQENPVIIDGLQAATGDCVEDAMSLNKSNGAGANSSSGTRSKGEKGTATKGKSKQISYNGSSLPERAVKSETDRIQVRLVNGTFTNAMKDSLLRDLNLCLFSSPPNSFVPSFSGSGLRFGAVWFAPDNKESCDWLKEKLAAINDVAGEFKFIVEPFSLYQNKVSFSIPWDANENLKNGDILHRLKLQNPRIPIDRWRIVRTQQSIDYRVIFCCIDDDSLHILRNSYFKINYTFDKVVVKVSQQSSSAKTSSVAARLLK